MTQAANSPGGASVAVLNRLEAWEANLVLNLRLWFEGPNGKAQVWNDYARSFRNPEATDRIQAFDSLLNTLVNGARRPLIRLAVGCPCVCADESVFLTLVRTASDGDLNDAALLASLLVAPARAEHVALLAGQAGEGARRLKLTTTPAMLQDTAEIIRLH